VSKKILWLISLAVLVVPLLVAGCGGGGSTANINISRNPGDSLGPRLVVDKEDGLHLVWFDLSTGNNEITYVEKARDGVWTEPFNISNNSSQSRSPSLAVDSQGTTYVAWHDFGPGKFSIFYSQRPKGGTWSDPYNVTSNREASTNPALAVDNQGTLHLVWQEDTLEDTDVYYTDIYYASRNQDGTWSEPVNISKTHGDSYGASIAVDSQDDVHVVWYDDTPGKEDIFYVTKPKGGEWSEPVNISNNPENSESPVLVVDSQDTVHLAWCDFSSGNWEILYASKPKGGSWSEPFDISRNISNSGVPALAVDQADNLYLAWNDDSPGNFDIFYVTKPKDGTWGKRVNVSQTSGNSGDPSIAVDNEHRIHFVWSEDVQNKVGTEGKWDIYYTSRQGIAVE
jgi:hypothetical protein